MRFSAGVCGSRRGCLRLGFCTWGFGEVFRRESRIPELPTMPWTSFLHLSTRYVRELGSCLLGMAAFRCLRMPESLALFRDASLKRTHHGASLSSGVCMNCRFEPLKPTLVDDI